MPIDIASILAAVRGAIAELRAANLPPSFTETFPDDHPLAGQPARTLYLKRTDGGGFEYIPHAKPRAAMAPLPPLVEHVTDHAFSDLDSLARWLAANAPETPVYLDGEMFADHRLVVYLDEQHPERGRVTLHFPRHPVWRRWSEHVGTAGMPKVLEHGALVSLMRDGCGEIDNETQRAVSVFSAAKKVTYDADTDRGMGLSVTLEFGKAGDAPFAVPPCFISTFPIFVGAWKAGAEPEHTAAFGLRVVPPKRSTDEWVPTFAVTWLNAAEIELAARAQLADATRAALNGHAVYLCHPDAKRFVVPTRA